MSFVNTIAEIVHSEVHEHYGAANKNIGDAFLLVWKFRAGFSCAPWSRLLQHDRFRGWHACNRLVKSQLATTPSFMLGQSCGSK